MPPDPVPLSPGPDAIAPDGSEVRILAGVAAGSMAQFTLPPGAVALGGVPPGLPVLVPGRQAVAEASTPKATAKVTISGLFRIT